jgi:predicted small lipoprotein YifL
MSARPVHHRHRRPAPLTRAGLAALVLVAALAACGKSGPPEPPPGEKDTLKQTYPAPSTYRAP